MKRLILAVVAAALFVGVADEAQATGPFGLSRSARRELAIRAELRRQALRRELRREAAIRRELRLRQELRRERLRLELGY